MNGDPKYEASQDLPDFPYAAYAELIGLRAVKVDRPDDVAAAWDEALRADRPCVIEAITDPNVPPLPPHITLQQAKAFARSVIHGDPDAMGMITQSIKGKAQELLPHRS